MTKRSVKAEARRCMVYGLLKMYPEATDAEIGLEVGISSQSAFSIRKSLGVSARDHPKKGHSKVNDTLAMMRGAS